MLGLIFDSLRRDSKKILGSYVHQRVKEGGKKLEHSGSLNIDFHLESCNKIEPVFNWQRKK